MRILDPALKASGKSCMLDLNLAEQYRFNSVLDGRSGDLVVSSVTRPGAGHSCQSFSGSPLASAGMCWHGVSRDRRPLDGVLRPTVFTGDLGLFMSGVKGFYIRVTSLRHWTPRTYTSAVLLYFTKGCSRLAAQPQPTIGTGRCDMASSQSLTGQEPTLSNQYRNLASPSSTLA